MIPTIIGNVNFSMRKFSPKIHPKNLVVHILEGDNPETSSSPTLQLAFMSPVMFVLSSVDRGCEGESHGKVEHAACLPCKNRISFNLNVIQKSAMSWFVLTRFKEVRKCFD